MTGKTHRAGGMLVSIVGFAFLQQKGLLLNNVNPAVQWLVMYPFCMWGSVASDLDHHWESCPVRDYPSRAINMALHVGKPLQKACGKVMKESNPVYKFVKLFNASHRSWQTHSDLTLALMVWLLWAVLNGKISNLGSIDVSVLSLVITGMCLGVIAHFLLDIITPEGVWCVPLAILDKLAGRKVHLPTKYHLVPDKPFFRTGGKWENFIYRLLGVLTALACIWFIYNLLPFKISFNGF